MSFTVENLEKNMAKLTITVSADDFEKALQESYMKNKNKISVPGFRKGKVPRAMIEKMYGAGIFYEDAANYAIPSAYSDAADECGLDIVSQPEIDITQIEKGKDFIFTATVAVKPEVTLGKYLGVEIEKVDTKVTADDVKAELEKVREQNSRLLDVTTRGVKDKDQAIIDFEGFVDGEAFEGGKGTDYPLTIGSHSFIDTFEEQLIGAKIGKEVEVNVTFPENYQAENLAGKAATFKVVVKAIKAKELPGNVIILSNPNVYNVTAQIITLNNCETLTFPISIFSYPMNNHRTTSASFNISIVYYRVYNTIQIHTFKKSF